MVTSKVDFHNHLIPGVDDGARTLEQSIAALGAMADQEIRHIITTPHIRASRLEQPPYLENFLGEVDHAWQRLLKAARAHPGIKLSRGFEIMLDVPSIDLSNPLFRLGGSDSVLVEFPLLSIPPHSEKALFNIKMQGFNPIVAHPERYRDVQETLTDAREWRRVGAYLQANAGSFVGQYGPEAERTAWKLLELGLLSYVCSDFHATGACHSEAAYAAIEKRESSETAQLLFAHNPQNILHNEPPAAVAASVRKRGLLARLGIRGRS